MAAVGSAGRGLPVVVTGASRGIGRAIALRLAAAGHPIIGVARGEAGLQDLAAAVRGVGSDLEAVVVDLGDPHGVDVAIDRCLELAPALGGLVNVAGMIVRRDPPDVTAEDLAATFSLNVSAPILLAQGLLGPLRAGNGAIVNVASLAAVTVTRASVSYQASKAALVQATRALAVRLGPGIRVNAVGPGYVETDLNREWFSSAENRAYVESSTALGRPGTVDDVAGTVSFLLSDDARYVTGQHLVVDGGWVCR